MKKSFFPTLALTIGSLFAAALIGFLLLSCAYALPTARMRYNVSLSIPYIQNEGDFYRWAPYHNSAALDSFTDSIMLGNAIYDSPSSPFHDALVNPRMEFTPGDTVPVDSLVKYALEENDGREVTYARYWHGYLTVLKPLLLFFTPADIRLLNMTVQFLLVALVLMLAYKRSGLSLTLPLGAAILCINPVSTALCLQYTDVYVLTLIFEIILLFFRTDKKSHGYLLYLWLGISIAFFDFLTYPLISLGFLLITEIMLCDETLLAKLKRMLLNSSVWFIGYGGMWAGKWILATLFTEQNVIQNALGSIQERTSSSVDSVGFSLFQVFKRNIQVYVNPSVELLLVLLFIGLLYLLCIQKRKPCLRAAILIPLLLCSMYPVVWTCLLANHSMIHPHMTYRNFTVSVMAIGCAIASCFPQKTQES